MTHFETPENSSLNDDYSFFRHLLHTSLAETLRKHKPLITTLTARLKTNNAIIALRIRKNHLYRMKTQYSNPETKKLIIEEIYTVNNALKKEIRQEREKFRKDQMAEIENLNQTDCRKMWQELKRMAGWTSKEKEIQTVLDEKQEEVCDEAALKVWETSFKKLGIEDLDDKSFDKHFGQGRLNENETFERASKNSKNETKELDKEISIEEINKAIGMLQIRKAAGIDEITAESVKKGGEEFTFALLKLIKAWEKEEIPEDWARGVIFPIFKDGDPRETLNYRGITLLSIVGKVYSQVLNNRLISWCEKNFKLAEQAGFRPTRGCPDQLFSLIEILRNRDKKGTFCCFIDVKKAFDRVFRGGLWSKLWKIGINGKLWRVLRAIYQKVESCVLVSGETTDWFSIDTGVRQGCVLSPILYAFFINGLIDELKQAQLGVEISPEVLIDCLLYADDIVLITDSKEKLQRMLDIVTEYARKWRFELNPKKSEVVVFGMRYPPRDLQMKLGQHILKQVGQYKYLGIELTRTLFKWNIYTKSILEKATRNMAHVWASCKINFRIRL